MDPHRPADRESQGDALLELAVLTWRTLRLCSRVIERMDAGEGQRYAAQLRYLQSQVAGSLGESGLTLVSLEGQPFDPGMAADPVNLGDFDSSELLCVDHMLEPIIMGPDGIRRTGMITLRRAGE